jgi:hypothetical protein
VKLPGLCGTTCSARFQPSVSVLNGIPFNISTSITWAGATVPGTTPTVDLGAYKTVSVAVSWRYGLATETQTSSSILYPGGFGPYTGSQEGTTTTTFGGPLLAVNPLLASTPSDPNAQPYEIDLSWGLPTPLAPGYIVEYSTDANKLPAAGSSGTGAAPPSLGQTAISGLLPSASQYQVSALAPSTTYYFEVISTSGTAWVASAQVKGLTAAVPPGTCSWSGFVVTGYVNNKVYQVQVGSGVNATFVTDQPIALNVNSNTECTGVTVTVVDSFNGTPDAAPFALTGSKGVWTGTIPQGEPWTAGIHSDQLYVNGVSINPPVLQSLLVCPPPTKKNPKTTVTNSC